MGSIDQKIRNHPELGITPEKVNGRKMYRHKAFSDALGLWISREKVKKIADRIPESFLPQYEAEGIVKIIQDFGLGEHGLRIAQWAHYNALMGDKHQKLPQYAAEEARKIAKEYNLGYKAIKYAEKTIYNALMGDKHQKLPQYAAREAIRFAIKFNMDDRAILDAAEKLVQL